MRRLLLIALFISPLVQAKFHNEAEVGLVNTSGNSQLETYNLISKNSYEKNLHKIKFGGHYTYGTSEGVLSSRNWDIHTNYVYRFSKRVGLLLGEIIEGDKFSGIETSYNTDLGSNIILHKSDKHSVESELAYRYTIEKRFEQAKEYFNKALIQASYKFDYNKTTSFETKLEYIPNFDESKDWQLNVLSSFRNTINSMFSLKVTYEWKKDNLPTEGATAYDRKMTTSLIATF